MGGLIQAPSAPTERNKGRGDTGILGCCKYQACWGPCTEVRDGVLGTALGKSKVEI